VTHYNKHDSIPNSLLGIVMTDKSEFVHIDCFEHEEEAELLLRVEDEDTNIPVFESDQWFEDVGLCTRCGKNAKEGS
jgi:hypothetical protein